MLFQEIRSAEALIGLVEEVGFLPMFRCDIPGFSVEEHTPPELWFAEDADGPWEWKGPAALSRRVVYGKLFRGKAGFVSRACYPTLANYRRDGYDFDARWDDGLALYKDKDLYDTIAQSGSLLSKELKAACGYGKNGNKGFETVITRLQMQTYVCIEDFPYMLDRFGQPYGWGVARYTTPEHLFSPDFLDDAYREKPADAAARIFAHLQALLPHAGEAALRKMIG